MSIKNFLFLMVVFINFSVNAQDFRFLSLNEAVDILSLKSPAAQRLNYDYKNIKLEFDNYKKSFYPSTILTLTPFNYNRSLNLLQDPSTGNYSYIEDNLGATRAGLTVSQNIGFTGGQLSINTSQNFVTEFSSSRNTFNSVPFSISYSQNLFGGRKKYMLEKNKVYKKNTESNIQYCLEILRIQQQAASYYILTYSDMIKKEIALNDFKQSDTLMKIAEIKFNSGLITKHDYNLISIKKEESDYTLKDMEDRYLISLKKMLTYLGLSVENVQQYRLLNAKLNPPSSLNKEVVYSYVNKNNSFELSQEIKKLQIETNLFNKKMENQINPNISLSIGSNQFSDNFFNSYRNPNSRQSVSMSLSIPIFKWGISKNIIKIAENNYKKEISSLDNAKKEFNNIIDVKVSEYNSAMNLFFLVKKKQEIYNENYELIRQTFILNRASIYDLFYAKQEQQNTVKEYIESLNNMWSKYFEIRSISLYDFINNKELITVLMDNMND